MLDLGKMQAKTFDLKFADGTEINILMPNNDLLREMKKQEKQATGDPVNDLELNEAACIRIINNNKNGFKVDKEKLKELGIGYMETSIIILAYGKKISEVMSNPN